VRRFRKPSSPADTLRQFVYGDAPAQAWIAQGTQQAGEPWASFERAQRLSQTGKPGDAAAIWRQIASGEGLESRHVLQAWHFLRQAGQAPPADGAKLALGAVAEMPVNGAHDLLAAYRDGSARYLNYSGKAVVFQDRSVAPIQGAIDSWLAVAQQIASVIGPWDQPQIPPVPAGHARVMVLTPSGPHFGQGPAAALQADPMAGSFLGAAASLLQLIVSRSSA
jgi:hypothetical protein